MVLYVKLNTIYKESICYAFKFFETMGCHLIIQNAKAIVIKYIFFISFHKI